MSPRDGFAIVISDNQRRVSYGKIQVRQFPFNKRICTSGGETWSAGVRIRVFLASQSNGLGGCSKLAV
jgi:hypothetical protein